MPASASRCSSRVSTATRPSSRDCRPSRWAASWATTSPRTYGSRHDACPPARLAPRSTHMNHVILKLLVQRFALAMLSLLAVSVIVFSITAVLPGDAAQEQLGQDATPEALAALRVQMGLDVPGPLRYAHWLGGLLTGDPGK